MAHQPQFFHSPIFFPCEIDLGKKQVLFVVQVSVLIRDKMFIVFPSHLTVFNLFIKNITTVMIILSIFSLWRMW